MPYLITISFISALIEEDVCAATLYAFTGDLPY